MAKKPETAIRKAYNTYLGRDASNAEVKVWKERASRGSLEAALASIANSPEAKIIEAYETFLGRTPSRDEIEVWEGRVRQAPNESAGLQSAIRQISDSEEAQGQRGFNPRQARTAAAELAARQNTEHPDFKKELSAVDKGVEEGRKITERTTTARSALEQRQRGEEQGFLERFSGAVSGQEALPALSQRLAGELGLPQMREANVGLQQALIDLESTLGSLPENVKAQTRGFDVNAAQLAAIQQKRAAPIQQQLGQTATAAGRLGTQLTSAENVLAQLLGLNVAQQEKELLPFQTEGTLLSNRLAREATGFNQQAQNELNTILARIAAGEAVSEAEKNRANQLAIAEQNFQNQLSLNEQEFGLNRQIPNTQVASLGGRDVLIDLTTGNVISDFGPTPRSGGGGTNISDFFSGFSDLFNTGGFTQPEPSQPQPQVTPNQNLGFEVGGDLQFSPLESIMSGDTSDFNPLDLRLGKPTTSFGVLPSGGFGINF